MEISEEGQVIISITLKPQGSMLFLTALYLGSISEDCIHAGLRVVNWKRRKVRVKGHLMTDRASEGLFLKTEMSQGSEDSPASPGPWKGLG